MSTDPSTDRSTHPSTDLSTPTTDETVDWTDLGARMWSFLTGREAAIHYALEDMVVEVPRDTGANAPRATWKFNGTLTITTSEHGEAAAPTRA